MKFFTAIVGAALVATRASAQRAIVTTKCPAPVVYVQSFPNDGIGAGIRSVLTPGATFTEVFHPSGSTIKIDTDQTLAHPLVFNYSFPNSGSVSYELSSELGNPFGKSHDILTPGAGCEAFDCAAFDPGCYSRPEAKKVYSCPEPVDLSLTLCA
ncbi:hypothetical protein F4818DRAFT_419230 [Hypoxylon cercidicola]|nr:hypothetical protein F4818DRAFT_419230 [Hypoxylon cercidicola]